MDEKAGQGFSKFVLYALRGIFIVIAVTAVGRLGFYYKCQKFGISLIPILLYVAAVAAMIYALKKNINKRVILISIVVVGFILRLIWCWSVKSIPVSDFNTAFRSAQELLNGKKDIFFEFGYFARYPHLIMFTLYMASVIIVFGTYALTALKGLNIVASLISIIFIYLIAKEIFKDEKKSLVAAFIMALFPASIIYTAVYSTETIAIAFFLASLYYFILVMNKKKRDTYLLLSGVLLLVGHLFRMVAQVIIVAYIMYIFIYMRKQYKNKFKRTAYILISFFIPFIIIGYTVIGAGITDTKLWSPKETPLTSVLKGSNINAGGRWNEEDAKFVEENVSRTEYLNNECKNRIIQRYTSASPSTLGCFFVKKLVCQWWQGDFAGAFWAESGLTSENIRIDVLNKGAVWFQLYYTIIFIMAIVGLFKKREYIENKIANIMSIIFCGYGILFLILETQERYGFIISWIFVLMAAAAIKPGKENEMYV